jgi:hypothetical protein
MRTSGGNSKAISILVQCCPKVVPDPSIAVSIAVATYHSDEDREMGFALTEVAIKKRSVRLLTSESEEDVEGHSKQWSENTMRHIGSGRKELESEGHEDKGEPGQGLHGHGEQAADAEAAAFEDKMLLFLRRKVPARLQQEEEEYESDIPVPLLDQDGNLITNEFRDRVNISPLSEPGDLEGTTENEVRKEKEKGEKGGSGVATTSNPGVTASKNDASTSSGRAAYSDNVEESSSSSSYSKSSGSMSRGNGGISSPSPSSLDIVKFLTRQNIAITRSTSADSGGAGPRSSTNRNRPTDAEGATSTPKYSQSKYKKSASEGVGGLLHVIDEGDGDAEDEGDHKNEACSPVITPRSEPSDRSIHTNIDDDFDDFDDYDYDDIDNDEYMY